MKTVLEWKESIFREDGESRQAPHPRGSVDWLMLLHCEAHRRSIGFLFRTKVREPLLLEVLPFARIRLVMHIAFFLDTFLVLSLLAFRIADLGRFV